MKNDGKLMFFWKLEHNSDIFQTINLHFSLRIKSKFFLFAVCKTIPTVLQLIFRLQLLLFNLNYVKLFTWQYFRFLLSRRCSRIFMKYDLNFLLLMVSWLLGVIPKMYQGLFRGQWRILKIEVPMAAKV